MSNPKNQSNEDGPAETLAVAAGSAWMEMPSCPGWWWRRVSDRAPIAELICEIRGKFYFASPYYSSIRTSFDEWIKPNPIVKFSGPILPPNQWQQI